jgi:FtsP/CotA-like multicopper oxidase with cupredoxin domain
LGSGAIGRVGPPLVLTRGEPTRVWVVNHLAEPTQVHWHGLEIESTYDGVGGTSGVGAQRAHAIAPGDSASVLLVAPRAGTFIYHTHLNDIRQLLHGLYGPLIVLDSGARWNPDTDRVFIIGDDPEENLMLNGGQPTDTLALRAGVAYRFRLINLAAFDAAEAFSLVRDGAPMQWTALAKDGATLPPWQAARGDARQIVNVGETYDYIVQVRDTGAANLEIRDPDGSFRLRQALHFHH